MHNDPNRILNVCLSLSKCSALLGTLLLAFKATKFTKAFFRRSGKPKEDARKKVESLQEVVARCEAKWFLEDLKKAVKGETDAIGRITEMLKSGYGVRQDEASTIAFLQSAWAIQNFRSTDNLQVQSSQMNGIPHYQASESAGLDSDSPSTISSTSYFQFPATHGIPSFLVTCLQRGLPYNVPQILSQINAQVISNDQQQNESHAQMQRPCVSDRSYDEPRNTQSLETQVTHLEEGYSGSHNECLSTAGKALERELIVACLPAGDLEDGSEACSQSVDEPDETVYQHRPTNFRQRQHSWPNQLSGETLESIAATWPPGGSDTGDTDCSLNSSTISWKLTRRRRVLSESDLTSWGRL